MGYETGIMLLDLHFVPDLFSELMKCSLSLFKKFLSVFWLLLSSPCAFMWPWCSHITI